MNTITTDVLCVGHACYDLVFSITKHPKSDEKISANGLICSGGGPAANAAIAVSKLGLKSAFAGYLGNDIYGEMHKQEFIKHNINTNLLIRGKSTTPLSVTLVKPDGKRALINFKRSTVPIRIEAIDFSAIKAKVILLDGHEPHISSKLVKSARSHGIPTLLDAGSLHEGTSTLLNQVDYIIAAEKFACQFADNCRTALAKLAKLAPAVIITLGNKGLLWQYRKKSGSLPAFKVQAIDTTGAGDAFHGAFAIALIKGMSWLDALDYASAYGALCCTKIGARTGLVYEKELIAYLKQFNK